MRNERRSRIENLGNLENLGIALPTFILKLPTFLKFIKLPNKLPFDLHYPNFLSEGV